MPQIIGLNLEDKQDITNELKQIEHPLKLFSPYNGEIIDARSFDVQMKGDENLVGISVDRLVLLSDAYPLFENGVRFVGYEKNGITYEPKKIKRKFYGYYGHNK